MTTPVPQKYKHSRPSRLREKSALPRLSMSVFGLIVAWLVPNMVMAVVVLVLNMLPVREQVGDLTPLLTIVGLAGLIIGLPLALLINRVFRHQLNHSVHVLGYALIGLLYGLAVLLAETGGLVPLLIPLVGFPAAILLALGRLAAIPLTRVIEPEIDVEAETEPVVDTRDEDTQRPSM
ncbi:hypothetical protein [Citricoccus muralis]|uniref:Uncharacterized protein n=1 Tax=Citricoccus muralis TaxID=169134 RepID=A0ABY8H8Y0_9MICC|nr:hypothetical protein [Citricoccus muralis]WFP17113.1 hypothetical protein P8192_03020 [Citricoccus muralis]